EKAEKDKNVRYFKDAYHKSCLVCHKEIKTKRKEVELSQTLDVAATKYGPTGCVVCHPKDE
ncbi:MAG: cytochrome c3 family protein, partial [Desulfobacterales bacterium]|nr:cytochrome c3 family protein [Desulfobacterales bacterium]